MLKLLPSEIGLFKVKDKSRSFLFYVPAFKINNLNKIPDIGLAFTRTQPDWEPETNQKGKLEGVFITQEDAKELAEIMWINLVCSKTNLDLATWKDLTFENAKVIWLPFYEDGIFLRDTLIDYAFQKVT